MRAYQWIKETRREVIREKRREIKEAKKALSKLRFGCAMRKIFDGTGDFERAVRKADEALSEMDRITKPLC